GRGVLRAARLGRRLLRAVAAGTARRRLVARGRGAHAVAAVPRLERPRRDRLGGDDRRARLRARTERRGVTRRDRLRRSRRRSARLPRAAPPPPRLTTIARSEPCPRGGRPPAQG